VIDQLLSGLENNILLDSLILCHYFSQKFVVLREKISPMSHKMCILIIDS